MTKYSVAIVGTGPDPDTPVWGESAAMAYRHGAGYRKLDNCDLIACADLVRENAEDFADEFYIDEANIYADYNEMLAEADPDIVSVCTPVPTHADIVVDCAENGDLGAIHCEKPMATTFGDCQLMTEVCEDEDIQLTFNHQRRFDEAWTEAKRLLDSGVIGELERVEMGGKNIFDYGSHLVDLCNYFNGEHDPEWVLGGIDYQIEDVRYGAHNENHTVAQWEYENGVSGLASTGEKGIVDCHNRLVGTEGDISVKFWDGPDLAVRRADGSKETFDFEAGTPLHDAIAHVVESLDSGTEPDLGASKALRSIEVIFGVWESARRRGVVEFPLDIEDNPLEAMVESGELAPEPADE